LTEAFKVNPDSEAIWLAAAKLELENGEIVRARVLLQRARERAPTARVFMKSALLEREQGEFDEALRLIQEGLKTFPMYAKLYMMGGQICSDDFQPKKKSSLERARKFYQRGLEHCTDNIVLWTLASRLEERASTFLTLESTNDNSAAVGFTKARSLLELSRLKNPQNPALWLEAIRLERRATATATATAATVSAASNSLMAKALQECPTSGLLWAEQIRAAPRVERKSKAALAIKKCPEDAHVLCAVAEFFASKREILKARKWLDRAVVLDPHFGDGWARYYAFETKQMQQQQQGEKDSNDNSNDNNKEARVLLNQVRERCVAAEPKYGEIWTSVSKDMSNRHKSIKQILELAAQKVLDAQNE
jgi:pre-mRNA-processing factor 6